MRQAKANSQNIYDIVTVMDARSRNLEPCPGKFEKRNLILDLRIMTLHSCFDILRVSKNHNTAPTEAISSVVNFKNLIAAEGSLLICSNGMEWNFARKAEFHHLAAFFFGPGKNLWCNMSSAFSGNFLIASFFQETPCQKSGSAHRASGRRKELHHNPCRCMTEQRSGRVSLVWSR